MLTAIIVAGGRSQRMGFDKLLTPLAGMPVVAHAIAAFEQTESVTNIILVGPTERIAEYEKIAKTHGFEKVSIVIPGGARRQDSVRLGLDQLGAGTDFVAVHEFYDEPDDHRDEKENDSKEDEEG